MKVLILFAHPRFSVSTTQKAMLKAVSGLDGVTIHDIYAAYPDFAIDVAAEQEMLRDHDLIVLQHPLYWYSAPAIIKEWLDLVLEHGWAYGHGGTRLAGKFLLSAVSTGGPAEAYAHGGRNRFQLDELLAPFNQTAYLCSMAYLRPFAVYSGRRLGPEELSAHAETYRDLIVGLRDGRIDPFSHLATGYTLPPHFAEGGR
ncbi:MAG: NAD(P)H-dependent oxidoreductase [Alphaproteobacteria bacterium]|nr:NAD(P)H-dependent oxidoreductase [Alphaproteobacteria bacterium]